MIRKHETKQKQTISNTEKQHENLLIY